MVGLKPRALWREQEPVGRVEMCVVPAEGQHDAEAAVLEDGDPVRRLEATVLAMMEVNPRRIKAIRRVG